MQHFVRRTLATHARRCARGTSTTAVGASLDRPSDGLTDHLLPPSPESHTRQHTPYGSELGADIILPDFNRSWIPLPLPTNANPQPWHGQPIKFKRKVLTREEYLSMIDACLSVGDFGRAEKTIESLQLPKDTPLAYQVHLMYLSALVEKSVASTEDKHIDMVWSWLKNMESVARSDVTPSMYALLCKSILSMKDKKLKQLYIVDMLSEWSSKGDGNLEAIYTNAALTDDEREQLRQLLETTVSNFSSLFQNIQETKDQADESTSRPGLHDKPPPLLEVQTSAPTMKLIKHSLRVFEKDTDTAFKTLEDASLATNLLRQKAIERNTIESALLKWRHNSDCMKQRDEPSVNNVRSLLWDWHEKMVPLIHAEQDNWQSNLQSLNGTSKFDSEMFLKLLSAEKLSCITLLEVMRASATRGALEGLRLARIILDIGKAVESEYIASQLKSESVQKQIEGLRNLKEIYRSKKLFNMTVRRARLAEKATDEPVKFLQPEWPQHVRAAIGGKLLNALLSTAKIQVVSVDSNTNERTTELSPAFYQTFQFKRGEKIGVIRINEELVKRLDGEPAPELLNPKHLPMVVPPQPWTSPVSGGYFFTTEKIMRTGDIKEQYHSLMMAHEAGNLDLIYSALDTLGSTSWTINRKIFDVIQKVWNEGKHLGSIPKVATDLVLPLQPDDPDTRVQTQWRIENRRLLRERENLHSQRCDMSYKLEIARMYLGENFYFPHNLDFRGRAYPLPPHLNHLGNDASRSLLIFSEAKPLGERGLFWLKVHLANLYGFDKSSLSDREDWTMQNMDNILDSVDHTFDGKLWWQQGDAPFQVLSTCFELAEALRSPDPLNYKSRIPIHQDGTCNGLQHYAALGGDEIGAKQVNLEPGDRPQDVYSAVAKIVADKIEQDSENGDSVEYARLLKGKITRKLVKPTVMTSVYGVTYFGARDQVAATLVTLEHIPKSKIMPLAGYVTKKIFEAQNSMFTGAHKIQMWLTNSAERICRSIPNDANPKTENNMAPVMWTSPLGLPIVQPYRKNSKSQVLTTLGTIFISNPNKMTEVDIHKHMLGFPPNYIHSLDATHMLMSALACKDKNISFAAVHDSYWCHACDVDKMSIILREAFVKLHKDDQISRLRDEFLGHYKNRKMLVKLPVESDQLRQEKDQEDILEGHDEKKYNRPEKLKVTLDCEKIAKDKENYVKCWVPLTFPPIPERGNFDVSKLRESKYFFS